MDISNYEIFLRILLACIFGGLIGFERESINRPAGFRTHILVCLGATIVMISDLTLLKEYGSISSIDPGRYGAQVISGIGFLGAGTIIKEGFSVKGLTTAASLWAVACLGLALGAGHYLIAISSTLLIFIILETFARFEYKFQKNKRQLVIFIHTSNTPGQLGKIGTAIGKHNAKVKNIAMTAMNDNVAELKLYVNYPKNCDPVRIIESIIEIDGIYSVNPE
ncbi:MgtC/SapB family protein [Helicovermis profundi]|uniref:MgtC/SapB family protein n=1 Tax=Helicovermis profundi TaxID=3065157 RepID=A0AAU9EHG6_9FIRM|nr:MgtC/SapB family protein [Clostridia bacterium S502]